MAWGGSAIRINKLVKPGKIFFWGEGKAKETAGGGWNKGKVDRRKRRRGKTDSPPPSKLSKRRGNLREKGKKKKYCPVFRGTGRGFRKMEMKHKGGITREPGKKGETRRGGRKNDGQTGWPR